MQKNIIRATSLTIENVKDKMLTLKEGESKQLKYAIKPNNTTYKSIRWESSNISIADVNYNGKITAKKSGEVKITGTIDGVKTSFTVKVLSYKYNFKGNTYKLAVSTSDLNDTINAIKTKKVYQDNGWTGRGKSAWSIILVLTINVIE